MKTNFSMVESVVKTLPIGLYCKRRVPLTLSGTEDGSYYSPIEDTIVISYKMIESALAPLDEKMLPLETAVRSLVYHELSHAMLTPNDLSMNDIINIFEDERIETLLRNTFLDVNFKAFVKAVNGVLNVSDMPYPKDAMDAFYQVVRFRCGHGVFDEFVPRVSEIIRKFAHLRKDTYYDIYSYREEIERLYNDIRLKFRSNPTPPPSTKVSSGSGGENGAMGKGADVGDMKQGESEDAKSKSAMPSDKDGNAKDESDNNTLEQSLSNADATIEDAIIKADEFSDIMERITNEYTDAELTNTLSMIISNFNKKNSGGSGINAYSGIFNPRAVAREDYRYFDKSLSINGNNTFGTFHLNLFVDRSGSFRWNEDRVNTLIKTLTELEKKNKNFSLDICYLNTNIVKAESIKDRKIRCYGGNVIPNETFKIVRELQKRNSFNYNLVLFDGDAFSDRAYCHNEPRSNWRAFDLKNCTIISDDDNEDDLNKYIKSAKVVITKNYVDEFINHVTKALTTAFR